MRDNNDDGPYSGRDHDHPDIRLARDTFTQRRRELMNHPEAVKQSGRLDEEDHYGNVTTWVVDVLRVGSAVTAFFQVGATDGYVRQVVPPPVTAMLHRAHAGLITKARRKTAKRVVADKRARGDKMGNPEALKKARRARRAKKGTATRTKTR